MLEEMIVIIVEGFWGLCGLIWLLFVSLSKVLLSGKFEKDVI